MRYEAEEGKCFKIKGVEDGYLDRVLYLGKGDSIDRYEQVNMEEKESWLAEFRPEGVITDGNTESSIKFTAATRDN